MSTQEEVGTYIVYHDKNRAVDAHERGDHNVRPSYIPVALVWAMSLDAVVKATINEVMDGPQCKEGYHWLRRFWTEHPHVAAMNSTWDTIGFVVPMRDTEVGDLIQAPSGVLWRLDGARPDGETWPGLFTKLGMRAFMDFERDDAEVIDTKEVGS